jgi:hypothetical protein
LSQKSSTVCVRLRQSRVSYRVFEYPIQMIRDQHKEV